MQSVFGFHDRNIFQVHLYATSPSDGSGYRQKIEAGSDRFLDVSSWSTRTIVERIVSDQIHIRTHSTNASQLWLNRTSVVNLGGYTKGSRNDIFAVRPCPVQISLMGFAGTLAAGHCLCSLDMKSILIMAHFQAGAIT